LFLFFRYLLSSVTEFVKVYLTACFYDVSTPLFLIVKAAQIGNLSYSPTH